MLTHKSAGKIADAKLEKTVGLSKTNSRRGVYVGKKPVPKLSNKITANLYKNQLKQVAEMPTEIVGAFLSDTAQLIENMRLGTSASKFQETASRIGVTNERLYELLRLPGSTIKARISKGQVLAPVEQDRLYRVNRVFERTIQVLEDEDAARKWIKQDNRALGGESPLSLLDTEAGYELVLDTLARVAFGVYA